MSFYAFAKQLEKTQEVPLSKLEVLAKEISTKDIDVKKLDEPIVFATQETRAELPKVTPETRGRLEGKGYPDEVIEVMASEAEAKIYDDAQLEPGEINGKEVLMRTDIDYGQKDIFGETNLDRMETGRAPLDANGKPIELHHIGQRSDSPLAELTSAEHRGNGNDNILHDKLSESTIDRGDFAKERSDHWKARAEEVKNHQ